MIVNVESQRKTRGGSTISVDAQNGVSIALLSNRGTNNGGFSPKTNYGKVPVQCEYCKFKGHTKDNYCKLHGYPT